MNSIYSDLVDALVTKARTLKLGDPLAEDTDVGPLITESAAIRVGEQVGRAISEGAELLCGGGRKGNFFEPTVLANVRPGTAIYREEIFGPVLPLIPFSEFDAALDLANDSPYGLQAAIYTQDLGRVMRAFQRLEVGTVIVNHSTAIRVENLPFGGTKLSGNTREGLHETLLDMTEQRTLLMCDIFADAG